MKIMDEENLIERDLLIERIKHLIKHISNGNVTDFGREFKIPQATLKDIVGKKKNVPNFFTLKKILVNEKHLISPDWLVLNIGDFQRTLDEKPSAEILKKIKDLEDTIALQNRLIKMQDEKLEKLMKE